MRAGVTGYISRELDEAHSVEDVQQVVKVSVRRLLAADGATFVLLDREMCYYADEDSMSPLWRGQRFPVADCISGWTMINRRPAVIADVRRDSRIPAEAYRPTFVRSLIMAPILNPVPLGALGAYWARVRRPPQPYVEALEQICELAADALGRFPEGLPDPGFPLQGAHSWQVRPAATSGVIA